MKIARSLRSFCTAMALSLGLSLGFAAPALQAAEALPSWNDGAAKARIVAFVQDTTDPRSRNYVAPAERIAVFDNDGTLWPENPMPFQLAFSIDELKRRLPGEPAWKDDPFVQAALAGNLPPLLADNYNGLFHIIELTGSGMSTVDFAARVREWFATAKHPRFERPYDQLAYQPMLEVLEFFRANGFKTFIVSGGGSDFMRVFSEGTYGIPPEQVVGSNTRVVYELRDSGPVLVKTMDDLFINDRGGKPAGIHQFLGQRPIACFGNSDGDQAMLEYTTINNPHPSLGILIHHTDAEREYAYDSAPKSSGKLATALAEAPKRGWTVVDMKTDWAEIFRP